MLEGITVLSEVTKLPNGYAGVIFFLVLFGCGMAAIGYCCVKYNLHTWSKVLGGIICFIVMAGCIVGIVLLACQQETYYKVMVDETITFSQFNELYKVLEQDGQILTVVTR